LPELAAEARERRKDIHNRFKHIDSFQADNLSNPQAESVFPFPFIGLAMPDRFKLSEENWGYLLRSGHKESWQYSGRRKFKELVQKLKNVQDSEVHNIVWLYGIQGCGKSHLLAVLVCCLIGEDERVVYIPDCRELLKNPVGYVRAAMLFAWATDITTQEEIMILDTLDEIEDFFMSQNKVLFVVDQLDAFNSDGSGEEKVEHAESAEIRTWIMRFTSHSKAVFGLSTNNVDFFEKSVERNSALLVPGGLDSVSYRKLCYNMASDSIRRKWATGGGDIAK